MRIPTLGHMDDEEQRLDWPLRSFAAEGQHTSPLLDHSSEQQSPNGAPAPRVPVHHIPRKPVPNPEQLHLSQVPLLTNVEEVPPRPVTPLSANDASVSTGSARVSEVSQQHEAQTFTALRRQPSLENNEPSYWNPFWLKRIFLIPFALLLTALVVVLPILWRVCRESHGFALVTDNHYSWTYGPTAVLVIIVSLWKLSDFWCRALTPWEEMRNGVANAERSVLLDYVSPMLPVTLWCALRASHHTVTLSVMVFVLLKITMVVSTGLFVSEPTDVPNSAASLLTTTSFDGSEFASATELLNGAVAGKVGNTASKLLFEANAYTAANLAYPEGLTADAVYQNLALSQESETSQNVSYSAEVDALYPDMNCEPAKISYGERNISTSPSSTFYASTTSCVVTSGQDYMNILSKDLPAHVFYWSEQTMNCTDGAWAGQPVVVMTLTDVRYQQTWVDFEGVGPYITSFSAELVQVTGIVCNPRYTLRRADVTYHRSGGNTVDTISLADPQTSSGRQLSGLSGLDLYRTMSSTISTSNFYLASESALLLRDEIATGANNGIITFGLYVSKLDYQDLLDVSTLLRVAETTFKSLSNQLVRQYVSTPLNIAVQGTVSYGRDRLFVQTAPMWIMVCILAVLTVCVLVFIFSRPLDVVPCNNETISGNIPILAGSRDMHELLADAWSFDAGMLKKRLSGRQYCSDLSYSTFTITVFGIVTTNMTVSQRMRTWWRPLASHWSLRCATLALPVALIITLEVLQRISNRSNDGIGSIKRSQKVPIVILTRIIPASIMVGVGLLFSSLEFTLSSLAPFYSMKRNQEPARRGIGSSVLGKIPPRALYCSIRDRHHATALAIFAALLGSILTIVSSGLYTLESVAHSQSLEVERVDRFDPSQVGFVDGLNPAATLSSLMEGNFTSYPPFTYGDLAIPQISLSEAAAKITARLGEQQASFSLRLPVLRASLACNMSSSADGQISVQTGYEYGTRRPNEIQLETRTGLPPSCLKGRAGGDLSYIDWSWDLENPATDTYMGTLQDLHTGPFESWDYAAGEVSDYNENDPGCPSLGFVFGHMPKRETDTTGTKVPAISNMTMMTCYQLLQEIDATVTFDLPTLQVSSTHPPVLHDSTARYLQSGPNGEIAFQYRLQDNVEGMLYMSRDMPRDSWDIPHISTFYQAVLFGRTPETEASLTGPENQERLFNATQAFYRRYMAQVISQNMRTSSRKGSKLAMRSAAPDPATATPEPLTGTNLEPLPSSSAGTLTSTYLEPPISSIYTGPTGLYVDASSSTGTSASLTTDSLAFSSLGTAITPVPLTGSYYSDSFSSSPTSTSTFSPSPTTSSRASPTSSTAPSLPALELLTATYLNPLHSARVYQNNASKITLQVLLSVMALCAALAYWLSDMAHTLPHNPCSIDGTMSLLAGSEMIKGDRNVGAGATEVGTAIAGKAGAGMIGAGAVRAAKMRSSVKEKELKGNGGHLYSLGWWPVAGAGVEGQQAQWRFGIDIGKASQQPGMSNQ